MLAAARRGSTHGYDVTDHGSLNPELGDDDAFDRFCAALREHGLGLVLDVVPNHMGVHEADTTRGGSTCWRMAKRRATRAFFDIDWAPPMRGMRGRVLLPGAGDQYGAVLEAGEIALAFDADAAASARTTGTTGSAGSADLSAILERAAAAARAAGDPEGAMALQQASARFEALPAREDAVAGAPAAPVRERRGPGRARHDLAAAAQTQLAALAAERAGAVAAIAHANRLAGRACRRGRELRCAGRAAARAGLAPGLLGHGGRPRSTTAASST